MSTAEEAAEAAVNELRAEVKGLEAELQQARAALGVAVMVMTPEQQIEWQRQMRDQRQP